MNVEKEINRTGGPDRNSYKELENKFKKWGKKTNYGRDFGEEPDQKKWMKMWESGKKRN